MGSPGLVYDPLEDSQIRLLRILNHEESDGSMLQVQLFHAHLSQRPAYTALSYSWGSLREAQEKILVSGQPFFVSKNLDDALRKMKENKILTVWADAICINQGDNREKSREITRIFAIYRMATTVVLWLGSDTGPVAEANDLVGAIERPDTSLSTQFTADPGDSDSSLNKEGQNALERLLSQPYWTRVWIIQEVAATDKARIFWGSYSFDLSSIEVLARQCGWDSFGLAREVLSVRQAARAKQKPRLMEMLAMTNASETTLLRDKVYGLLGLASDWTDFIIEPTYSQTTSEIALCLDMTYNHIIWTNSADIIFLRSMRPQQQELPSWCPHYFLFQLHGHDKNVFRYICGQNVNLGWEKRRAFGDPSNMRWTVPDTFHVANKMLTLKGNRVGRISHVDSITNEDIKPSTNQTQEIAMQRAGNAFRRLLLLCYSQTYIGQDASAFFSLLYSMPEHVFHDAECVDVKRWLDSHRSFFEMFGVDLSPSSDEFAFIRSRNRGLSMSSKILPEWREYLNISNDNSSMRRGKDGLHSMLHSISSILQEHQRLMFMGDESLLGWAHRDAEIGDTVWHLEGCSLQAILRRSAVLSEESGEDVYQLVGHAYVDSVMASGRWITKSKRRLVHLC